MVVHIHATWNVLRSEPVFCLFDQPLVVGSSVLAIWCVCAPWPVQGTLVWDAPGFLWERLTFQFWWIRLLLTHCVSSFGKLDFRKPNRSRTCWGELEFGGGVSRGTDVCLWYLMREWTIACPWSSGHPADNYWLKDCHHTPLLLSPLRNIDAVGVRASLLWQN